MSLWVSLEPLSSAVEAGESVVVSLRIRNIGDIVEEYHVDVVGDPALWCVVEPSVVRLLPGTTGSVSLTFSPPRTAESAAGPHPYAVRVTPVENPDAVMVPEGRLTVAQFVDVRAELVPPAVRGWRHAKPRLVVSNYGNTLATASVSVSASGSGNRVDFDIRTPSLQVQPGRAHFSVLRLRPERVLWRGQKVKHPFTATLQVSGREPVTASGTYLQSALLPRWLGGLFAALMAVAVVFAGLWIAARPSVTSDATAQVAMAGAPPVVVSSPTPPPPSSPQPSTAASSAGGAVATSAGPPPETSSAAGVVAPSTKPTVKTSSAAPPAPAVVPAPVGNWLLNQTGGNVAVDSTNAHNGTASNGWFAGGACLFNGTNSQIVTNGPVLDTGPGGSFTVFADVYLSPTDSVVEQTMVSQDGKDDSGFYLQYLGNGSSSTSGLWSFARVGSDTPAPAVSRAYSTAKAASGVWTRLAGVFDATDNQLRLYVNGQLQQAVTDSTPYTTGGPLAMGRAQFDGKATDWFDGALSNVEVFNQALDATQINAIRVSH